jgi:hypothetical protein
MLLQLSEKWKGEIESLIEKGGEDECIDLARELTEVLCFDHSKNAFQKFEKN